MNQQIKITIAQPAQSISGLYKTRVSMRAPWILPELERVRFIPCSLEWRDNMMNAGGGRGSVLHKPNPDGIANAIQEMTQAAADHGYTVIVEVTPGFRRRWGDNWRNPAYCGPQYAESRRRALEEYIRELQDRPAQFRCADDAQRIERAQAELATL